MSSTIMQETTMEALKASTVPMSRPAQEKTQDHGCCITTMRTHVPMLRVTKG
jgi:hypothetical protein